MDAVGAVAATGASMSVDVMGQAGVGHQGYYDTTPPRRTRQAAASTAPVSGAAGTRDRGAANDPAHIGGTDLDEAGRPRPRTGRCWHDRCTEPPRPATGRAGSSDSPVRRCSWCSAPRSRAGWPWRSGQWRALLGLVPLWLARGRPDLRPRARLVGRPVDRRPGPAPGRPRRRLDALAVRRPPPASSTTRGGRPARRAGGHPDPRRAADGRARRRPAIIQNHAARTWAATARSSIPASAWRRGRPRPDGRRAGRAVRGRVRRQPDRTSSPSRSAPSPTTAPRRAEWVRQHARADRARDLGAHPRPARRARSAAPPSAPRRS